MAHNASLRECIICTISTDEKENKDETFIITKKGCESVADAARKRGLVINIEPGMEIHTKCLIL
jgi:hypothetical protein